MKFYVSALVGVLIKVDGIYLNNYRMCPHFMKERVSRVASHAGAGVQNFGYILGCMFWVNVWLYPAMCGLTECAKYGKYCGYFSAVFYA